MAWTRRCSKRCRTKHVSGETMLAINSFSGRRVSVPTRFGELGASPRCFAAIACFLFVAAWPAVSSAQSYRISHFVGGPGGGGFLDGPAANARFDRPLGAAVDSAGNVFIADGSS